ncbi:GH15504 [Drosophila grimshawi]|uniref:GH15504 n=1 Tax=Drosophila grimshawi TaxID=7222 RepID=B4J1Z9_DROGR|nr:GH15504 [Drosophila grimshawi]
MNVLDTFLTCYEFLTDPITDLELDLEFTEKLAEKCEKYLKGKQPKKSRFENIEKYTRNEIVMMDELIPSPNVERILEVVIDQFLGGIHI